MIQQLYIIASLGEPFFELKTKYKGRVLQVR